MKFELVPQFQRVFDFRILSLSFRLLLSAFANGGQLDEGGPQSEREPEDADDLDQQHEEDPGRRHARAVDHRHGGNDGHVRNEQNGGEDCGANRHRHVGGGVVENLQVIVKRS